MFAILPSRIVSAKNRLSCTPAASTHAAEPTSLSSPTCVKTGRISNRCNPRLSIWDLKTAEAVYQAVPGNRLITGQLLFADRDVVLHCMNIPKLPGIS